MLIATADAGFDWSCGLPASFPSPARRGPRTAVHMEPFAAIDACGRGRRSRAHTIIDRAWRSGCCARGRPRGTQQSRDANRWKSCVPGFLRSPLQRPDVWVPCSALKLPIAAHVPAFRATTNPDHRLIPQARRSDVDVQGAHEKTAVFGIRSNAGKANAATQPKPLLR